MYAVKVGQTEALEAGVEAMGRGHYATALRAFRNLAKTGDAQAENNIGYLYERGLGVPQDYGMALKWYKLAAVKALPEGNTIRDSCTTMVTGLRKTSQRPKSGLKGRRERVLSMQNL